MKTLRRFLCVALLAGGLAVPATARADSVKEGVFTLGVHLGNADGVLFGLTNSYDTRKAAHPGGVPLIRRQLRWSIDLAKVFKLPTADLEALEADLERLEFAQMRARLQPTLTTYRALLAKTIHPQAAHVFDLGLQLTMGQQVVQLALNHRPEHREKWRPMATSQGAAMTSNITTNKLEATLARAADFTKRCGGGEAYDSLAPFLGQTLPIWTEDFRKAPAWGTAGPGVVITRVSGSLTKSDPADAVRKGCFAKVHNVTLKAGETYTIDLTSGDGRTGPGFFDVWLRIEDASGKVILNNDDGGEGLNARATFQPKDSGTYRMVVTSYRTGATGSYTLTVRQGGATGR